MESETIPKHRLEELKKEYTERIKELHPASDIAVIDWLEDRIQFIDELLNE